MPKINTLNDEAILAFMRDLRIAARNLPVPASAFSSQGEMDVLANNADASSALRQQVTDEVYNDNQPSDPGVGQKVSG